MVAKKKTTAKKAPAKKAPVKKAITKSAVKKAAPAAAPKKVKAIKEEVASQHKVRVHIDLEANDRFEYVINGMPIPMKRIRQLRDLEHQRFELQLECLKTLRDSGKKIQAMQLARAIIER